MRARKPEYYVSTHTSRQVSFGTRPVVSFGDPGLGEDGLLLGDWDPEESKTIKLSRHLVLSVQEQKILT